MLKEIRGTILVRRMWFNPSLCRSLICCLHDGKKAPPDDNCSKIVSQTRESSNLSPLRRVWNVLDRPIKMPREMGYQALISVEAIRRLKQHMVDMSVVKPAEKRKLVVDDTAGSKPKVSPISTTERILSLLEQNKVKPDRAVKKITKKPPMLDPAEDLTEDDVVSIDSSDVIIQHQKSAAELDKLSQTEFGDSALFALVQRLKIK